MNILCTICSDLVNQAENIYVTKCGHIFHHHCLAQWIERSKSCPQCRHKVTEKCMFRLFPTVSNENSGEDAAILQSRLDNAQLELRQERAKFKDKDDKIATLGSELKRLEEVISKYEKQLVSYDSKVKAIREQLTYANLQSKDAQKLRDENEVLKKNMQTLNGLQKVLNATCDDVEQMLQGYSDVRTIATFATALKRALCDSESKKNEWRDRLHMAKQQLALEKESQTDLQNKIKQLEAKLLDSTETIESLKNKLKTPLKHQNSEPIIKELSPQRKELRVLAPETPRLNDAILDSDSDNVSFNTMVDNIENSDSPYLNLKQGGLLCLTALQRAPIKISDKTKPSEQLYLNSIKNATKKRLENQMTTSIFHRKGPMKMESFQTKCPLDISYDGMGGHSKLDTFPVPKKSPIKSCIPKISAKHKLKRPNPTGGAFEGVYDHADTKWICLNEKPRYNNWSINSNISSGLSIHNPTNSYMNNRFDSMVPRRRFRSDANRFLHNNYYQYDPVPNSENEFVETIKLIFLFFSIVLICYLFTQYTFQFLVYMGTGKRYLEFQVEVESRDVTWLDWLKTATFGPSKQFQTVRISSLTDLYHKYAKI